MKHTSQLVLNSEILQLTETLVQISVTSIAVSLLVPLQKVSLVVSEHFVGSHTRRIPAVLLVGTHAHAHSRVSVTCIFRGTPYAGIYYGRMYCYTTSSRNHPFSGQEVLFLDLIN